MDWITFLFDTRIILFRQITLFTSFLVFILLYYKNRNITVSIFQTIFLFLCSEWAWQISTLLRWGVITPNFEWLQVQSILPVLNMLYLSMFLIILPHILKSSSKKTLIILFLPQLIYQLIFNLSSPSVLLNDYGYVSFVLHQSLNAFDKAVFLFLEYGVPKMIIFLSALTWKVGGEVNFGYGSVFGFYEWVDSKWRKWKRYR